MAGKAIKTPDLHSFRLDWVEDALLREYRKVFGSSVYINRELSNVCNAYMVECLREKGIKIKFKGEK